MAQLDGLIPKTSLALVDDVRRSENGESRGGAKYNNSPYKAVYQI